jgi:hypothetical protein
MKFSVETALEQTLVPPVAAELGPAVVTRAPPARITSDPDIAEKVRARMIRLRKGRTIPTIRPLFPTVLPQGWLCMASLLDRSR